VDGVAEETTFSFAVIKTESFIEAAGVDIHSLEGIVSCNKKGSIKC
tara:strand:- start:189 stop:326 length:138 start_codon:yes stop_codon:yes gene_type:complete